MQNELFELPPRRKIERPKRAVINGRTRVTTAVFEIYWRFAAERHAVFLRRLNGFSPITTDPILEKFKFTNAYRILDRTTQYLVRNVIMEGEQSASELFFRILLFKLFNKIETWQLLVKHFGQLTFADYRYDHYDRVLTEALLNGRRIYSAAYIMPSGGPNGGGKKHRSHLKLLEMMLRDGVPQRLNDLSDMRAGFEVLRSYPMIGDFLAYQFITDLNYSTLTSFGEMEFVIPGPGALDGLKKCFPDMTPSEATPLIQAICENQAAFQRDFGLEPIGLWGRPLQLIDCQNLFCETDKYARVACPDISGFSGRTRIKQNFRMTGPITCPVFPEKWQIAPSIKPSPSSIEIQSNGPNSNF